MDEIAPNYRMGLGYGFHVNASKAVDARGDIDAIMLDYNEGIFLGAMNREPDPGHAIDDWWDYDYGHYDPNGEDAYQPLERQ